MIPLFLTGRRRARRGGGAQGGCRADCQHDKQPPTCRLCQRGRFGDAAAGSMDGQALVPPVVKLERHTLFARSCSIGWPLVAPAARGGPFELSGKLFELSGKLFEQSYELFELSEKLFQLVYVPVVSHRPRPRPRPRSKSPRPTRCACCDSACLPPPTTASVSR